VRQVGDQPRFWQSVSFRLYHPQANHWYQNVYILKFYKIMCHLD